jgi:hypothetical protein
MAVLHDLVLVHIEDKPSFYARIEDVSPDVKSGWWKVRLLVLTVPVQVYTWILDESQINGAPFTMGGTPIQLEKVIAPEPPKALSSVSRKGKGKVVSLFDRKEKE